MSSGGTLHLPSVGHISAKESSLDTACQKKFIPYIIYLYHDRYHSTLPRLYHVPYYLSVPVGTDNSWPGIVNDNVFACLGTVLICSPRLSVTTENLGDHAHGRLWVESQRAGDVENTVAMPNVARIRLLTHVNATILTK